MLVKQTRLTKLIAFLIPAIIWVFILLQIDLQVKTVHGDYQANWGVLALNSNKSYYYPGEEAKFEFAVLDDTGYMVCDAKLSLTITDKKSGEKIAFLSSEDKSIKVSPDCERKDGHLSPDFSADFRFKDSGDYNLNLSAKSKFGEKSLEKTITVTNEIPFEVERKTATRIFPSNTYRVDLEVKANRDFSGQVIDTVPSQFTVSPSTLFKVVKSPFETKNITWHVSWQKGKNYELTYFYKAPLKSPTFYEIGPLKLIENESFLGKLINKQKVVFQEKYPWQIAGDNPLTSYTSNCVSTGPKNFSNPTNAQGAATLGSSAALASFTTSNSAVGRVSDDPTLDCSGFYARDLGTFNSATVYFSFATEGSNNGDDSVDFSYDISGTPYTLGSVVQIPNQGQSNSTNGGYWSYPASNITSWTNLANTTVHVTGAKNAGPDRNNAYVDAVWVVVDYTPRTYTQNDFEWYTTAGSVSLSNVWPSGIGDDLAENAVLTQLPATNDPLTSGDQIRLQMNFTVGAANLSSNIESFNLQYSAAEDCTTASGWQEVGAKASGTIWRLFDETALADTVTQVNQISTSDSGAEGNYSEIISTGNNPNAVNSTQTTEWDWPLEDNGAADNTTYCFRMVLFDGSSFDTYNADGYPKLTTAPGTSNLLRHGNIFQNSSEKGFFWAN